MTHPYKGLVVVAAGVPWHRTRLADQNAAERLTAHAPVLYVDPPVSPRSLTADEPPSGLVAMPRLRKIGPRLVHLSSIVAPGKARAGINLFVNEIYRAQLKRAVARLGGDIAAVIAMVPHRQVLGLVDERVSVYWAADDFEAAAPLLGLPAGRLRRSERRVAERADVIITSSPLVQRAWESKGRDPYLVPFGCEVDLFARTASTPPATDIELPSPIVGFHGHVSGRIDLRLLEAIAARGRSLLLVGPRQPQFDAERLAEMLERPNVQWVGARPFEELPSYLRAIDVGIVPYATADPFNQSSFPLKTLEYLAAGKAVVATPLPATRWLDTDLVEVAEQPVEFADAVDQLLANPIDDAGARARREFATAHSWEARARQIAQIVGLTDGTQRRVAPS